MKSIIIAAVTAVVVLSGCSVYRAGQTPDDVYYSPGPSERGNGEEAYVEANGDRDDGRRYNDRTNNGYDDFATADDRWLMMRVRNRNRWSYFDDYNNYNPYSFYSPYSNFGYGGFGGFGGGFGGGGFGYQPGLSLGIGLGFGYDPFGYNRFNDYYNWNSYYNPYYPKAIVVNPRNDPAGYNSIRNFNRSTYNNRSYNNSRSVLNPNVNNRANQGYNNSNNRTLGNSFRRVFSNSNSAGNSNNRANDNYRTPSQDRPVRTYNPSSNNSNYSPRTSTSGSSSGSSGSSGSSSGSRPNRR